MKKYCLTQLLAFPLPALNFLVSRSCSQSCFFMMKVSIYATLSE